jgi:hypothetical protein
MLPGMPAVCVGSRWAAMKGGVFGWPPCAGIRPGWVASMRAVNGRGDDCAHNSSVPEGQPSENAVDVALQRRLVVAAEECRALDVVTRDRISSALEGDRVAWGHCNARDPARELLGRHVRGVNIAVFCAGAVTASEGSPRRAVLGLTGGGPGRRCRLPGARVARRHGILGMGMCSR